MTIRDSRSGPSKAHGDEMPRADWCYPDTRETRPCDEMVGSVNVTDTVRLAYDANEHERAHTNFTRTVDFEQREVTLTTHS